MLLKAVVELQFAELYLKFLLTIEAVTKDSFPGLYSRSLLRA